MPNERIAAVRALTLIFHAKDDSLQLYRNAEFAASIIPGARLVSFERGGQPPHCCRAADHPGGGGLLGAGGADEGAG